MARIRTYEQQFGTPDVTLRSNQSVETAGMVGNAISKAGGQIAQYGEIIHKNDVAKDVTTSHAELSRIRNDFTRRIQEQTARGTIDIEKIQTEYQDEVNKITGNVSTREGKNYLEKRSATLGSDIFRTAAISQAQVAGKRAVEQWQQSIDLNGNTLQQSPASFSEVLNDSISAIDEQVQSGTLDVTDADKLKRLSEQNLAENAVRGWANISSETAKTLLDQGTYDKYLSPDQKQSLYGTIKAHKAAEETEKERVKKIKEEEKKKAIDAWENDNVDNLLNNTLTPKQILESSLDAQKKIQWNNMMRSNLRQSLQTDPAVKNSITQRILLPDGDPKKITDRSQIMEYVGKGLTIPDFKQLGGFLDSTPDGRKFKDNRRMMLKQADATLVRRDPITGQPDPQGNYSLSLFQNALIEAEEKMRADGKDVNMLYDPTSKDYFGHQILKYKSSPQEIFQRTIDFKEFKMPSGVKEVRGKNETAADYLKRINKGG